MSLCKSSRVAAFAIGLFLMFWTTPGNILASEPFVKVGTYTINMLWFPRGVRSLSLGGIGAADATIPNNTYHNPAVSFVIDGVHLTQGYNTWPASDIDFQDYGAYTGKAFEFNSSTRLLVGGGIRYTHMRLESDIDRTIFLPRGGSERSFDFKDWYLTITAGGGISTELIDVGIGISAKPTKISSSNTDERFLSYDLGCLAQFKITNESGLRVIPSAGASVLNIGGDVDVNGNSLELPDEFRAAMGLRIESPSSPAIEEHLGIDGPMLTISGMFEYLNRMYPWGKNGTGIGFELGFIETLSLRMGYSDDISYFDGATYGIGLGWQFWAVRFQFDYARFPAAQAITDNTTAAYGTSIAFDL